jgi:hypothetical protein
MVGNIQSMFRDCMLACNIDQLFPYYFHLRAFYPTDYNKKILYRKHKMDHQTLQHPCRPRRGSISDQSNYRGLLFRNIFKKIIHIHILIFVFFFRDG